MKKIKIGEVREKKELTAEEILNNNKILLHQDARKHYDSKIKSTASPKIVQKTTQDSQSVLTMDSALQNSTASSNTNQKITNV